MDLGLVGSNVVVTGGSKGLGRAIAAEFAAEGANLTICSRNARELEGTAADLVSQAGGAAKVTALRCDVTDPDQVTDFIGAAAAAMGGIDVLVKHAGAARPGRFTPLTDEDWRADIDVKLMSQIRCTRAALPHLRRSSVPDRKSVV